MALHTSVQERLVAASIAALIVMLAGYALIVGLSVDVRGVRDRAIALIDLHAPPPPPPPKQRIEKAHSKAAKQAPSPRNLKNEATKIVVPSPVIPLPAPPPIITAPRASVGIAPYNGASNRAGPGQGAGGEGNGLGGGGDGDGDDIPPRLVKGKLKYSDLPKSLQDTGAGSTASASYIVGYHFRVGIDGRTSDCTVTRSSGSAELDHLVCQLVEQRYRYKPSRDFAGDPVSSWVVETQRWDIDRSDEQPPKP